MKHLEKTTDRFRRSKFRLPQNLPSEAKSYTASRVNTKELLVQILDLKMEARLKETEKHLRNVLKNVLTRMRRRKKGHIMYIEGGVAWITTG